MTLREVAKAAGVSRTTVSLVINNVKGSRVSQSTKKRVLGVIRKLDYNPHMIAKRLALGKTNSIGLYIPFTSPVFRNYTIIETVGGIQDVLNRNDYDLVLFSGSPNLSKERPIDQIVKQNTLDGLIIVNTRYTTQHFVNRYMKNLTERNFNFVVLHYYWGNAKINYIGVDYEDDAFKSVSHLVDLGHKDIALLTGPSKALITSKIIKGYKRAMHDNQIIRPNYIIEDAEYDYQKAYAKTQSIIRKNPSITAFFVAGYEMAPGCLKGIKDLGLNVPKDVSIICYIDNEMMSFLDPPLTAVRIPYYDIGKKAAELALRTVGDKKRFIFETELVVRGSTARPQGRGSGLEL